MITSQIGFEVPAEVLRKVKLVESLMLDKILFTYDVQGTLEKFSSSSKYLGSAMDVHMFNTSPLGELYGITAVPKPNKITRYYNYRFQYSVDPAVFKYVSSNVRTVLAKKDGEMIIYTNHNDSQTMVIVKYGYSLNGD